MAVEAPSINVSIDKAHSTIESAKRKAAYAAVAAHFDSSMPFVGIGSGSTIVYGVEAIVAHLKEHPPLSGHINWFVPTGYQSRKVIEAAGLNPLSFDSLPADAMLSVAFDGADEVDSDLNCIKGGGACLFQEKLVALRAKKFVCIADYRKKQENLLVGWPSIPIEIVPMAEKPVLAALRALGSTDPKVREVTGNAKAGPLQTDQNFYIVDAPFRKLLNRKDVQALRSDHVEDPGYTVPELAEAIKAIPGVLEVGLFWGINGDEAAAKGLKGQGGQKPVAVYFGMNDGEVSVLEATKTDNTQ
jgi:ribose 5-phosphate isomerase A